MPLLDKVSVNNTESRVLELLALWTFNSTCNYDQLLLLDKL